MYKGNNWELIVLVGIAVIVIGVGVWALRRKNLKEKSGESLKTIKPNKAIIADNRTIYHIFNDFINTLSKEGLIKGDNIYRIEENAKQTFLKEVQRILNSNTSFLDKRKELINLFYNWRENPEIMNLFKKIESVLNSFRDELETKEAKHLPLLSSHYDTTASNAWEAIKKFLYGLMEDGISSAKGVIKVKMEFLEKDIDEELIKERLEGIRQKVEEELEDERLSNLDKINYV